MPCATESDGMSDNRISGPLGIQRDEIDEPEVRKKIERDVISLEGQKKTK